MPNNVFNPLPVNDAPMVPPSNGGAIKQFFVNMMSDPGLSPMGLGVVAGSKGAQALVDALLADSQPKNAAEAAVKFAQLKYPRLMSKVLPMITKLDPMTAGSWKAYPRMVGAALKLIGNQETGPMLINSQRTADVPAGDALADALSKFNTVGHELTHGAIQATRTPAMVGEDYIPFNGSNYAQYASQPAEVNAQRGGATASKTLLNFLAQYPELNKFFGIPQ